MITFCPPIISPTTVVGELLPRCSECDERERHSSDEQGTAVFMAASLEGLADMFTAEEIGAVATKTGFVEAWRGDHI
jgi:hypothetical protein